MQEQQWRFCLAPMMDWTDRHCRYFWRLLSSNARLYTEMVTTGALLHGDRQRFLRYHPAEHPLALQLGGSNPQDLAQCAKLAEDSGFDEVNLNCGCPSDRVQNGKIGACLMAEPDRVAECVAAMQQQVRIPVTVKHRLGIDDLDSDEHLHNFVGKVAEAGCKVFIVHARKAWLSGLSPKENRDVPPLQYDRVVALKRAYPQLRIVLNGGLKSLQDCQTYLSELDGVMMGREAYQNPYLLADVDQMLFGRNQPGPSRQQVAAEFAEYAQAQLDQGARLNHLTRHILGLFAGVPGGRQFRRHLSETAHKPAATLEELDRALSLVAAQRNSE